MSFSGIQSEEIHNKEEDTKYKLVSDYNEFIGNGNSLLIGTNWTLHGDIRTTRNTNHSFTSFLKLFEYLKRTDDDEADFIRSQKIEMGLKIEVDECFYEMRPPKDEHDISCPEIFFSSSGWVYTNNKINKNLRDKIEHKLDISPNISEPIVFFINYLDERPEVSMHIHEAIIDFDDSFIGKISAVLIADPRFWALEGSIKPQMFINPNAKYPIPGNILEKAPWYTIREGVVQEPETEIYAVLGQDKDKWKNTHKDFIQSHKTVYLNLFLKK